MLSVMEMKMMVEVEGSCNEPAISLRTAQEV